MDNAATCSLCSGKGRIVILSRTDDDRTSPPDHAEWIPCPRCVTSRWRVSSRDPEAGASTQFLDWVT